MPITSLSTSSSKAYRFLGRIGLFLALFAVSSQFFRLIGFAYPDITEPERAGDEIYIATDGFAYEHIYYLYKDEGPPQAAKKSDLLILGNSRVMLGVDYQEVMDAIGEKSIHPHWMGFQGESHPLPEIVIEKHQIAPELVVINADNWFFQSELSGFASVYVEKGKARALEDAEETLRGNSQWRFFMQITPVPQLNVRQGKLEHTRIPHIWRSTKFGDWIMANWELINRKDRHFTKPTYEELPEDYQSHLHEARELIKYFRKRGSEVLFILVPNPDHNEVMANALGQALDVTVISTKWDEYQTFDDSHLTPESAKTYTQKVFEKIKETSEWERAFEE